VLIYYLFFSLEWMIHEYGVEQIDDSCSKREWDFSNFGENMLKE